MRKNRNKRIKRRNPKASVSSHAESVSSIIFPTVRRDSDRVFQTIRHTNNGDLEITLRIIDTKDN